MIGKGLIKIKRQPAYGDPQSEEITAVFKVYQSLVLPLDASAEQRAQAEQFVIDGLWHKFYGDLRRDVYALMLHAKDPKRKNQAAVNEVCDRIAWKLKINVVSNT